VIVSILVQNVTCPCYRAVGFDVYLITFYPSNVLHRTLTM
jgi:hypothetical protein